MIKHPVKLQEPDHSKHADQQPKEDLISGEHNQQRDRPKRDGADKSQNKDRAWRDCVRAGLLKRGTHLVASS